ncbi:hypothetical protein BZA77DRAFT_368567 [Pyronema omphalodes]|nr:hypothetical protein BZA77DRAFT_368567 [Pyronema omphalodes]
MKIIGRDVGKSRSNTSSLRPVSANALHRLLALLSAFTYCTHREVFTRSDLMKLVPKRPCSRNTAYVRGLLDLLAELCPHKSGESYAICLQVKPPSVHRATAKSVLTIAGLNGVPDHVNHHLKNLCGFMQRCATVKDRTETETKAEILKKELGRQVFYAQDKLVLEHIGRMITSLDDLIEFCVSPEEGGIDLEKHGEVLLDKMNRVSRSINPLRDDDNSVQVLYDCTVKAGVLDYTECVYYLDRYNNGIKLLCEQVHNRLFSRNFPDKVEVVKIARLATTVSFPSSKKSWTDVLSEFMKEHDLIGLSGMLELVEAAQNHYPGELTTILPVHPEIQLVTHFNFPKPVNPPIRCIGASKGLSAISALFLHRWKKDSPPGSNVKEGYAKRGASEFDNAGKETDGNGCSAKKCLGWLCPDPRCPVALMYEEEDEEEIELAEMMKKNVESKPDQNNANTDGGKKKKRCKGNCPLWRCPDMLKLSAGALADSDSDSDSDSSSSSSSSSIPSSSSSPGKKRSQDGHDQGWGPGGLGTREDWSMGAVYNI